MLGVVPTMDFPMYVYWNITSLCNLRCTHCLSRSGIKRPGELTSAEAMSLLDELIANRAFYLYIAGGEPFLRKDLFAILEKATSNKISVSMATNGTYMTPEKAARLKELRLTDVMVSMDGGDSETHDAFRMVPGAFNDALRAMDLLLDARVPMSVGTVVCRQTVGQLDQMYDLLLEKGVPMWRLTGMCPVGRGHEIYYQTGLSAAEIRTVADFCARKMIENGPTKVTLDDPLPMKIWALEGKSPVKPAKCGAGRALCCVQFDGTVTPCVLFDHPIDNIRNSSLKHIWQTSEFFHEMREVNATTIKGKCTSCSKVQNCNGACRAHAWFEYRDIKAPDPVCLREDIPPSQVSFIASDHIGVRGKHI
jgi:radical SAM protein with 4Fe4S-binding SPASM domain